MNANERLARIALFLVVSALSSVATASFLFVTNDCAPVCEGSHPPASTFVRAGSSDLGVRVQIFTDAGLPDGSFVGTVLLTSSDPLANLPPSVTFTAVDGGIQALDVVLHTLGPQSITATDPSGKLSPGSLILTVLGGCVPTDTTLCLALYRFSVTAFWGDGVAARAVPITNDTGYFWFFDPDNIEVITKLLNGCDANGHFWLFGAGLTNVGTTITVTDTITSAVKEHSWNPGVAFQPIQDSSAFPCR